MRCKNCGFDSPDEMRYCGQCGTLLGQVCAQCGFTNPAGYRYCGRCGAMLAEGIEAPKTALPPIRLSIEPGGPKSLTEAIYPQERIKLEGERRIITAMLTDVTGSTELLERVGSEAWVDLMNRILYLQETEVYRYGGEVDQFRGDGLVAFFGASSAQEDDPERAILAGLSMQKAVKQFAQEINEKEGINLQIRVGINTGEVIVASVGDRRQHSEDTAMGFAIAVAARMESAAEPDTVLVSENTYRLVRAQFEWLPLGQIMVKGVSYPINVYRPLAPKAEEQPEQLHLSEFSLPLIGREAEFQTILHSVENLYNGSGGVVLLMGEEGMGKSFLVNEVRQYCARRGSLIAESGEQGYTSESTTSWIRGRCRSYNQAWPYSMWIDLLRNWLGIHPDASKMETRERLHAQAQAMWGDEYREYYPYLTAIMGLPQDDAYTEWIETLDASGLRQRIFFAVRSWLEVLATQRPLVLVFSDLQWADVSSLELLRSILPLCEQEAVLYILIFRPERQSQVWQLRHFIDTELPHRTNIVTLAPLNFAQCSQFIDQLVGRNSLPDATRALIVKNSEGNPHYILELIRSLIDDGKLVRDHEKGNWRLTQPVATIDLPDSLLRLLTARMDRLSTDERYVLQVASVIGPIFWLSVIEAVAIEARQIRADLAALQKAQLIYESGRITGLGMQYTFRSELIRDAVCEGLLSAQRVAYHLHVAEYLETLPNPDILFGYFGIVAYHYRQARQPNKELYYTLQAAGQAKSVYANAEALQGYQRAIELLNEMEAQTTSEDRQYAIHTQKFEVLFERRQLFYLNGDIENGNSDSLALLHLARQIPDDPAWQVQALLIQPEVTGAGSRSKDELVKGLAMAEEALRLSQQLGDKHREMYSLGSLSTIYSVLGDVRSEEYGIRGLEIARQLGDVKSEVRFLLGGFGHFRSTDNVALSRKYLEEALRRSESLNDKVTEMILLGALGPEYELRGDYYRHLTEFEQKRLQLCREIGDRLAEGQSLMFCGQIKAIYLGDYEAGLEMQYEALRHWEKSPAKIYPLLRIAQIQVYLGIHSEALATLEEARPISKTTQENLARAGFHLVTCILYNELEDEAHLRMVFEHAHEVEKIVGQNLLSRQYAMVAACEQAHAHLKLSKKSADRRERKLQARQALEWSQKAVDIYQEFGFTGAVECVAEEILIRHSLALGLNNAQAEADRYLESAYNEMMRKLEMIPLESHYRNTFLNIGLHRQISGAYEKMKKRIEKG